MDKSREQFEAEITKNFGDLIDQRICKNGDGEYMAWDMQVAWWAWKASRAAVEIELPKYHEYTNQDTTRSQAEKSAYNSGVYDSAESIRAAGLKVKGE
ncbi:hypothetical protein R2311_002497 [Cronobacter dublinensis]|nr:hypothetical protein [Cronobacter dublinensis]